MVTLYPKIKLFKTYVNKGPVLDSTLTSDKGNLEIIIKNKSYCKDIKKFLKLTNLNSRLVFISISTFFSEDTMYENIIVQIAL